MCRLDKKKKKLKLEYLNCSIFKSNKINIQKINSQQKIFFILCIQ